MQLFADTSGRPSGCRPRARSRRAARHCSARSRPARSPTSAPRSPRRDPARRARTRPTAAPRRSTTRSTRSTASLYETLGRTQVELLHELKRIRNQRRAGMNDQPRIGLLGIMQELYDDMIPGITEHQAAYAAAVAARLGESPRSCSRGRRATARTSSRSAASSSPPASTGSMIVMLTYGPAMRTVRALIEPAGAVAAREHPARARGHGRVGHGRPDLQPGDPRRPGPGERAGARRRPVLGDHRRLALGRVRGRVRGLGAGGAGDHARCGGRGSRCSATR